MAKKDKTDAMWFNEKADSESSPEQKKIQLRRETVFELYFMRNMSQRAIANIVSVHYNTVGSDLKYMRDHMAKKHGDVDADTTMHETAERMLATMSELWMNYTAAKKEIDKQRYLELFHKVQKDLATFKLDVGLMPRAASRSKIEVIAKEVKEMSEAELLSQRDRLVNRITSGEFDASAGEKFRN